MIGTVARAACLLGRVVQNVIWGVLRGLLCGSLLCGIGLLLRLLRGTHFLDSYGIGFGTLLLTYLGASIGAGVIAGLCRPLLRTRSGAIVTGVFGGIFAFGVLVFAMQGPISGWGGFWIVAVVAVGAFGGARMGNGLWEEFVEPTLPRPSLPPGPPRPRPPLGLWHP